MTVCWCWDNKPHACGLIAVTTATQIWVYYWHIQSNFVCRVKFLRGKVRANRPAVSRVCKFNAWWLKRCGTAKEMPFEVWFLTNIMFRGTFPARSPQISGFLYGKFNRMESRIRLNFTRKTRSFNSRLKNSQVYKSNGDVILLFIVLPSGLNRHVAIIGKMRL